MPTSQNNGEKNQFLSMYFAYFAIIELPVVTQEQSALNGKNSKKKF